MAKKDKLLKIDEEVLRLLAVQAANLGKSLSSHICDVLEAHSKK